MSWSDRYWARSCSKGCPNLRQFCLRKSAFLSDNGLVSFVKVAGLLESLQLEECHKITQLGFFGSILKCGVKLKALVLLNCLGIRDLNLGSPQLSPCESLRSLTTCNCPGFGDVSLALLGKLCPQLQHVELSGLQGVTDAGFIALLESCGAGTVKVNLSGGANLSNRAVSALTEQHGWTFELLNLERCGKISDGSLAAIVENCFLLSELDDSKSCVSDSGLRVLARSKQLNLQIFSASSCSMIANKSLLALVKMGQTLLGLNLQHCNAIIASTVDLLVERLWRCDILS